MHSFPFSFVDRDMFMRFLGTGIGHCSQHTAERVCNEPEADGSQTCIADDETDDENTDDEEGKEGEAFDDDTDSEVNESEGDDETDDDDVGYDAL